MHTESGSHTLLGIAAYTQLDEDGRAQLDAMANDMLSRGIPLEVVESGVRSTARLMLEQQQAEQSPMEQSRVRAFLHANGGRSIARTPRAHPRREVKAVARERLLERVNELLASARVSRRKHEILRARRDLLGLDQAHLRRTLGTEGDAVCTEINVWLSDVAARLNRGAL